MASPVKLYQREMHENLGFFPTWFPGDQIEIGDVGIFSEGRFRKMSSLNEVKIPFKVSQGVSKQSVQYTSTKGTSITPSAGAAVSGIAKVEISVNFSHAGSFVFHANGLSPRQIENRSLVAEAIVMAYKRKEWKKEWLLVEALHTADVATIIVSEDSKAGVILAANVDAPLVGVYLADPKVSLSVTSISGKVIHVVGAHEIHPLYSCLRLKDHFFSDPSLVPVRGIAPTSVNAYERPGIDELLDS